MNSFVRKPRRTSQKSPFVRDALEIAHRLEYDPVRIERHARLLSVLDPFSAEALRCVKLPARRRCG